MNYKELIEQSLYVQPMASAYYPVDNIWCHIPMNVFGLNELRPRIGTFTTPWNLKRPNSYPVIDCSKENTESMSDILDRRAVTLSTTARERNKKIVVMWSGGLDSTAVLAAFIKNLTAEELKRIVVCCNTESINENPHFYHTQIKDRLEMLHILDLGVTNEFLNTHIMLTGDPADCIVGPSTIKYKSLILDGRNLLPWKDNLPLLYKVYESKDNPAFAQWWVDKISANIDEVQQSGLFTRVTTISDWHWWQYYNLKYNGSFVRPFTKHKKYDKEIITQENIKEHFELNFFGHEDFQSWSYTNLHRLLSRGLKFHKEEFRDYIFELDGNEDYRANKVKLASWGFQNNNLMFMDNDCVMYRYNEPGLQEVIVELLNNYRG